MPRSWRSRARPSNGNVISGSITSGDLGGLLAARAQVINPALNQLGQVATALSTTVNSQQAQGLDLSGQFGARDFLGRRAAGVRLPRKNTDAATASVAVSGLGALTANDYVLAYNGGAYSLTAPATGRRCRSPATARPAIR